ncbi:MAG: hypothetical protein ACJ8CX_16685 [Microvirga sp.]|jgi:hypothetical protein
MWLGLQLSIIGGVLWFGSLVEKESGETFGYAWVAIGLALAFIATCLLSGLINFIARCRRPSAANRPQEGLNACVGVMVKDLIAKPSPESGHDRAADNRCGRYGLKSARQRALRQASGSPAGA